MSVFTENLVERSASRDEFPELAVLLARIKQTYDPIDVVLYGSRARGEATPQSDWDIKVIVSDDAPDSLFSSMLGWRIQEGSGVYADVSCTRLSDFRGDLAIANSAASHIANDGILLDIH